MIYSKHIVCIQQLSVMFVFQPEPKDDIEDDRTWTFRHMKAANIPTPHMQVLTPPQDMNCNRNVDERGPGMCVMCIMY